MHALIDFYCETNDYASIDFYYETNDYAWLDDIGISMIAVMLDQSVDT